jgi:outer membrane protein TolC
MRKLVFIPLLLIAFQVKSQEISKNGLNENPEILTLNKAISYALENKAEAKKAKLKVENSEYQIQEIRSRALPQISANGGLNNNPILQTTVIDGNNFGAPGTTIQAVFGQNGFQPLVFH